MSDLIDEMAKVVIAAEVNRIAQPARWLGTFPQSCLVPVDQIAEGPARKTMVALRKVLDAAGALHEAISELSATMPAREGPPSCDCPDCAARRKNAS